MVTKFPILLSFSDTPFICYPLFDTELVLEDHPPMEKYLPQIKGMGY